jgi:hypothetical protein
MPFSQDIPGGLMAIPQTGHPLFKFPSNIREGLGTKMRVENN